MKMYKNITVATMSFATCFLSIYANEEFVVTAFELSMTLQNSSKLSNALENKLSLDEYSQVLFPDSLTERQDILEKLNQLPAKSKLHLIESHTQKKYPISVSIIKKELLDNLRQQKHESAATAIQKQYRKYNKETKQRKMKELRENITLNENDEPVFESGKLYYIKSILDSLNPEETIQILVHDADWTTKPVKVNELLPFLNDLLLKQ